MDFFACKNVHHSGERATAPIAPPWRSLAALLLVAGTSLRPPHALPDHPMTAHSALSNCRFKVKANAARYAQQRGISVERAQAELTQQAERNNDSAHAARLGANDSPAQAFLKELGAGISMVDPITGEKYQLFAADQATGVPAQRRANGTGGGRYIG